MSQDLLCTYCKKYLILFKKHAQEGDTGKENSNKATSGDVDWVMEVVRNPCQGDPEGQACQRELDDGPDDLGDLVEGPDVDALHLGEV